MGLRVVFDNYAARSFFSHKSESTISVFSLPKQAVPSENGLHRSNSEKLVNSVGVVEVANVTAVCDGGGGVLGHPVEYIQLNTVSNEPAVCKYCGLRFRRKADAHH